LNITAVANRDHSWGLRNEAVFDWHYWTGAHFNDWFSNWCLISDKLCEPPEKHGGFISTAQGNIPIKRIEVKQKPEGTKNWTKLQELEYRLEDDKGEVRTLIFDIGNAIGPVYFPNVPVEKDIIYEMADWWGTWKVKETDEVGRGLNEMARLRKTSKKDRYAR
jgi:hypothetical protein